MSQSALHLTIVRFFQCRQKHVLLTAMVVGLVWMSGANLVWSKEPPEWETLSQGQVVVSQQPPSKDGVPSVEAKILVARPPAKVWTVVSDPEKLMRNEEKVRKVKVLSRTTNKQNVEFSVLMTHLLPPFNYVLMQELAPPSLLRFHRISGSFRDIQGSWNLTPVENGSKTILTYTLKLDPGPFIPRSLLLTAVKSDLPNMMRNAKTAIDKNTQ